TNGLKVTQVSHTNDYVALQISIRSSAQSVAPSIVALPRGGYEVAFEANTNNLWTVGADNHGDWRLGMMAGTTPSIARFGSGYEVAFQANTGNLWTVGGDNHGDWGLGMMKRTNPSIAALATGGYEVAFEANTSYL